MIRWSCCTSELSYSRSKGDGFLYPHSQQSLVKHVNIWTDAKSQFLPSLLTHGLSGLSQVKVSQPTKMLILKISLVYIKMVT